MSLEDLKKKLIKQGVISKSRKIRRGVRKGSIHFHIVYSRAQELKASSCSLHFYRSV